MEQEDWEEPLPSSKPCDFCIKSLQTLFNDTDKWAEMVLNGKGGT